MNARARPSLRSVQPEPPWSAPPPWRLIYTPRTGSTNDDAKQAALAGCPDRTVFVADEQTRGRGRLGRAWIAPSGCCLLLSIVFRKPVSPIGLVALCSVAIADTISELSGLAARIKWPNDVMLDDRKVGGLLAEVIGHGESPAAVVGIGLNVNLEPGTRGLPPTATSLAAATGRPWARQETLAAILRRIDRLYELPAPAMTRAVWPRWESLLWRRRQVVRIDASDEVIIGTVEGLGANGALRLRDEQGGLIEIQVGDVLLP